MDDEVAAYMELLTRQEDLHPDLKPWIVPMSFGGMMLKHPLVFSPFHGDGMNAQANASFRYKLAALEGQSRLAIGRPTSGCTNVRTALRRCRLSPPICTGASIGRWCRMFGRTARTSGNTVAHGGQVWLSQEPERHTVMDDEEREHLAGLPDGLTIYRGVHLRSAMHGLSWTLDRDAG